MLEDHFKINDELQICKINNENSNNIIQRNNINTTNINTKKRYHHIY